MFYCQSSLHQIETRQIQYCVLGLVFRCCVDPKVDWKTCVGHFLTFFLIPNHFTSVFFWKSYFSSWKMKKHLNSTKSLKCPQKGILTSLHVRAAPKSWSNCKTHSLVLVCNVDFLGFYALNDKQWQFIPPPSLEICVEIFQFQN